MARAWYMVLLAWLSGCSSLSAEQHSDPDDWPALNKAPSRGCILPAGTFENLPFRAQFEYGESPYQYLIPAPRLNDVLGVAPGADPTHLLFVQDESDTLAVKAFDVRDGRESLLDTRIIKLSETRCQNHRWFNYVLTLTDDGALALRRKNMESALFFLIYSRAAMDDDWFPYRATDAETVLGKALVEAAARVPEVTPPSGSTVPDPLR